MKHIKRDIRSLALRLVAAMLALFRTPIKVPIREMSRAWRRRYGLTLLRLHGVAPMAGAATLVASRTPLFYKSVPGGPPVILDTSKYTGNIFYVDSAVGVDSAGYGSTPDAPLATIDYAIGLCTANQGDVILVLPGHAETVATLITCDKAGVRIIGLGAGNDRPALTVSAVIDGISITADDVTIENLRFVTPSAAATADINIAAARATVRRCWFEQGANLVSAITVTAAGERPVLEDCVAIVTANGPGEWVLFEGVVDLPVIRRNIIIGSDGTNPYDNAMINFGATICTNAVIRDNVFGDGNQAVTVFSGANVLGEVIGPNFYAALAVYADTAPALGTGVITAAVIANAAIDAATFAADALQAIQDEAEDALEGEDLDHLMMLDSATQPYPVNLAADSALAKVIAKGDPATPSSFNCTTDSLEALSDKIGAFSGDGGAVQDDSIKASLDLLQTAVGTLEAEAEDALEAENLDHLLMLDSAAQPYPVACEVDSVIAKIIAKGDPATPSTYNCTTDSLEMLSDKVGAFSGDGGAAADDSAKALLDLLHTDIDAILADTGTDGVVLGADSLTAAKIADAALASEHFAPSAGEKTTDGIVVTRATAVPPQSTSENIFTVTGLVLLKRIVGVVTVAFGAGANATKLKVDSTGAGATTDLCATLDLDAKAADNRLEITGTFANALVATLDVPLAKVQVTEIVLPPGSIMLDCAGNSGAGTRVRWSVTYVPLESGAQIVAA